MAKIRSKYECQQCGYSQTGWAGKCPECDTWGSLVEVTAPVAGSRKGSEAAPSAVTSIADIKPGSTRRTSSGLSELDRVLGGGIVPGQAILIAGEPGIGKSTILLQLANNLGSVLYVSGEESPGQIKIRADRLGVKSEDILLLDETDVDKIVATVYTETTDSNKLNAIIIDSIQTMQTSDLSGMPGAAGQVRETANRLVRLAKQTGIPVFIVGHVTKEGSVAGPAALAHVVDTVLWFEGDKSLILRLLRAVKNRFGPTDEVGIFQMEDKGLVSIENAGGLFLTERKENVAGSAIGSVMEGTRPILIEIQSLVVPTKMAFPRRIAQGIDSKRLELILAVLTRRNNLRLSENDVYVNIIGGIKVKETGIDLALSLSIASAYFDKALPPGTVAIGEVGLLGEIRSAPQQEKRIKDARRQGYKSVVTNSDFSYLGQAIKKLLK